MQRLAQEEVDRLNEEGNASVGLYKEQAARAKDATLSKGEQDKAQASAAAKLEEIKAKQAEIKSFTENTRRALEQSPLTAELRALELANPLPADAADQRRAEERNALEVRKAQIRERANAPTQPVQP
jgi:hypothetical protein